jgi:hypothetical protein
MAEEEEEEEEEELLLKIRTKAVFVCLAYLQNP